MQKPKQTIDKTENNKFITLTYMKKHPPNLKKHNNKRCIQNHEENGTYTVRNTQTAK